MSGLGFWAYWRCENSLGTAGQDIPRSPPCGLVVTALVLALLVMVPSRAWSAVTTGTRHAENYGTLGQPVLHVASPDWRDQVLYFALTDRFDDGDRSNNDQHAGEFDPSDAAKYNGGDLRGIIRRLDYIRGLGATGVWISPPVLNRWWDPGAHHGGYHGYWAKDFSRMDPHVGTLADYQALSRALHGAGMVLVQDIVLNHTANYLYYDGGWDPADPAKFATLVPDSVGDSGPTQAPFDQNDPRKARDLATAAYHWTPDVRDFRDPAQVHGWQMAGLDDINSENPRVRATLRKSYGDWIREVGVDGFRIDTALYVPNSAFEDFLYSDDLAAPGILASARATGRDTFHVFGEGFAIDKPYQDIQARRIDALMHRADGSVLLPGMLDFPLYGDINAVFARGAPTAQLGYRIADATRVYAHPELMASFLDNHDVDRFLAGGDQIGLKQALLLMFTLPGIPVIYYGTEQGFTRQRAAMFARGSDSGGVDHFDTTTPLYRTIAKLSALRREHRVFSRGKPTVLADSAAGPGVLAYRMDGEGESALVLFNIASGDALVDNLDTGIPGAQPGAAWFTADGPAVVHPGQANVDGRLSMRLPPRSGLVFMLERSSAAGAVAGPAAAAAAQPRAQPTITLDPIGATGVGADGVERGDFEVNGQATGLRSIELVADGDLAHAQHVAVGRDGRWRARVDTSSMFDPAVTHRLVAFSDVAGAVASRPQSFRVERAWTVLADVDDPAGDDTGPAGNYRYPTDWPTRTLDIRHVRIEGAGSALRLTFTMAAVSTTWNPPNGFDHVAFNVFVQVRGRVAAAASAMPMQHATVPAGMRWNLRLRAHGWTNALFTAAGASADADGTAASPAPVIAVDQAARTISFTFSPGSLGAASLSGAKVYAATWDYDAGFRQLLAEPAGSRCGGGDGSRDPLVMDDTTVLELP
ncbi:alpha-amylase family glycosyl hydrolase [soil metagenome]